MGTGKLRGKGVETGSKKNAIGNLERKGWKLVEERWELGNKKGGLGVKGM